MKKLKPILDKPKYSEAIEKKIISELRKRIFEPLMVSLGKNKALLGRPAKNAKKSNAGQGGLEKSILEGLIEYNDGFFTGKFSAKSSKEIKELGGAWNKTRSAFKLDQAKIPQDIKQAIRTAREIARAMIDNINAVLDDAAEQYEYIDFTEEANKTIDNLSEQLQATTAKDVEIEMSMEGFIADKLRKDYTENMNLYIKKWQDEQIVRLREQVQKNAMMGGRASRMVEAIQAEYGVTTNKAKFLARNETSILVSQYREENYKEAGVVEYMWSTSLDGRVRRDPGPGHKNRGDHAHLQGKVFRWDSPPVVDLATGRRAHPGMDYQCRCVAIPVVKERK